MLLPLLVLLTVFQSFGELTRRMFVEVRKVENVRCGATTNYEPNPPRDEIVRASWIGTDDIRSPFRALC
jgi:hypothetical protein